MTLLWCDAYKAELTLSSRLLPKQLLAGLINVDSLYASRLAARI